MSKSEKLVRTSLLGVLLSAVGIVGCASGDGSAAQQDDTLNGDSVQPACGAAQSAKAYSGRAVAVSVRVNPGKPTDTAWDGTVMVGDTKALPSSGGSMTKSLATPNVGPLVQAAAFNGSAKGADGKASAGATVVSASVLHTAPEGGILGNVLGEDGRGGTVSINLRDVLQGIGVTDDLLSKVFQGPLAGGIQADVLEEKADSWCEKGEAHSSAEGNIVHLTIGGKPIRISPGPNLKVLSVKGLVELTVNEQVETSDEGSSSMDASALHVKLLDGRIDVRIAHASSGVTCGGSDGAGCVK